VTNIAAADQAERALSDEVMDRSADQARTQMGVATQRCNRELVTPLAFQANVAEEVVVDGPLENREAQARHQDVFELLPDVLGVDSGGGGAGKAGLAGIEMVKGGFAGISFVLHDGVLGVVVFSLRCRLLSYVVVLDLRCCLEIEKAARKGGLLCCIEHWVILYLLDRLLFGQP